MKKSLVLIFIALLVLAGCAGRSSTQNIEEDYHKGTNGILINFLNNAPPSRVYEGDRLDIGIEIKNKGAYPEMKNFQGKLELTGFEPSSIRGSWDGGNGMPTNLEGKNQNNPDGGYAIMTYKDRDGVHVPFDADYYEPNILVHTCYKYKTIADPNVCIDPDPFEIVEERKVCKMNDISLSGGQGAPIAVTKIDSEPSSQQVLFRVHIANEGNGKVMLPRAYSNCPFDVEFEDLDKVTAKIKLPYDSSPDCTPKGTASDPIRLTNNKGYIFCKFRKPGSESAYTTNLNIELDYVYSNSISKQIKIINLK